MPTSDFGGSASKVISVRGLGGSDDYCPNGSSSAALHLDDVYKTSNLFLSLPFFDAERVEVLKGPQGTLYGRRQVANTSAIQSLMRTSYAVFCLEKKTDISKQ